MKTTCKSSSVWEECGFQWVAMRSTRQARRGRAGKGGCGLESAEGPGPLHPRGSGGADPRTFPHAKDRSSYGGCSVCLAEDTFEKALPIFSLLHLREVPAGCSGQPPIAAASLPVLCFLPPTPCTPSLTDRAPVPCPLAVSRATQARGRALVTGRCGQRGGSARRPGPGSAAVPVPLRALPAPGGAAPGLPRPGREGLLNARPVYL